jgi:hypothetical protein
MFTSVTPSVLFRLLGDAEGESREITILVDEAEDLSREAQTALGQIINVGYRRGQTIPRTVQNQVVRFPVYCPKAFSLIGDVRDTMRDRSIVLTLERGKPAKSFTWQQAESEGHSIRDAIRTIGVRYLGDNVVPQDFVGGRESEIWTPLFSLATVWCPADFNTLTAVAADLAALKTQPKRRYLDNAESEEQTREGQYAERALKDLSAVLGDKRFMLTADAVTAMRDITTGPWRVYKGEGLNPIMLANLLSRFGVAPKQFKVKVAGRATSQRGYERADVLAAVKTLGQ